MDSLSLLDIILNERKILKWEYPLMIAHEQSAEQAEEVAGVGRLRHCRPTEEEPGRWPASNIQVLGG